MKLQADAHLADAWNEELIKTLHADIVTDFMKCESPHQIKAAVEFVKFLNHKGIDSDNVQFYLSLFLHPNESVIQAFLGDGRILNALIHLQRNQQLIQSCLELLSRLNPDCGNPKILISLLTILYLNYHNADSGFRIYALQLEDLYQIGKYLDKNKPQTNKLNRLILDILADIGELKAKDTKNSKQRDIAAYANKIRNAYFDSRLSMAAVLPQTILS